MADIALKYQDLANAVSVHLGYGTPCPAANTDEVDLIIQRGVRRVYFPPATQIDPNQPPKMHDWSWLRRLDQSTITLATDTTVYSLPSDFGGGLHVLTYLTGGRPAAPIQVVRPEVIQAAKAAHYTEKSGTPSAMACVYATTGTNNRTEWKVEIFPEPDTAGAVEFWYSVEPPTLATGEYPYGGAELSELYLESCLAVAETAYDDNVGVHTEAYYKLLAAAIQADLELRNAADVDYWHDETEAELAGVYLNLLRAVGVAVGYGIDPDVMSTSQKRHIENIIQRGSLLFYYPPAVGDQQRGHVWSFLRPYTTLAVTDAASVYDLPSNFATMAGDFVASGNRRISFLRPDDLRAMKAARSETGVPQYFTLYTKGQQVDGSQPVFQVEFYPAPDASYTLSYQYAVKPKPVSSTDKYILGGDAHYPALEAACLYYVNRDDAAWSRFIELLTASAKLDLNNSERAAAVPASTETYTRTSLGLTRADLMKAVASAYGWGLDLDALTGSELSQVNEAVDFGLRRFYQGQLDGRGGGHVWSFLRPTYSFATVASTESYAAPSDCENVFGNATLLTQFGNEKLTLVSEYEYAAQQTRGGTVGYLPVLITLSSGYFKLYPTPDAAYQVVLTYDKSFPWPSGETSAPLGGTKYGDTMRLACLAEVKPETYERRYLDSVRTAVLRDRRDTPTLGLGQYGVADSLNGPDYARGSSAAHYKGMISSGSDTVYLEEAVNLDEYTQQIEDLQEVLHLAWAGNSGVIPTTDYAFFAVSVTSPVSKSLNIAEGKAWFGSVTAPVIVDDAQTVGPFETPTGGDRKDIIQLSPAGVASIKQGVVAASPDAPTVDSGYLLIAEVYCREGMSSVKSADDGTNGYFTDARVYA